MIDWAATSSEFGYTALPKSKRPKVVCSCDECGKTRIIAIRVKSNVVDGQMPWVCPSCVKLRDSESISSKMTEQWADQDYRQQRVESSKELWESTDYRALHSTAVKTAMQSVDMSSILKKRYEDPKERQKHRDISIALWNDQAFRERVAVGIRGSAVLNGAPSSLHTVFAGLLDDIGVDYVAEQNIGPYNFDFCILIPDGRDILVEIHGDYWHNRADAIQRDNRKSSYALRLADQYDFMVIWEFEFYTNGRVFDRLKQKLGIEPVEQIEFDFSDVSISEIDARTARVFLTQYHYSGSLGRGGTKFGAYLGSKLIAVVVYSSVGRKETATTLGYKHSEVLEISRFCIHSFYHKRNFASWFLARTNRLVKTKCLVAFSDSTFGHIGTIYLASNFIHIGVVKPTYWYVDKSGWVMHKKTLYEHARSLRMTEREFAEAKCYRKIFGAQKDKFIKIIEEHN